MLRTSFILTASALCLATPHAALARANWLEDAYNHEARTMVAQVLAKRGIAVAPTAIQIVSQRSVYPRLLKRTGTAHLSWKVSREGSKLAGTVEVKGAFGLMGQGRGLAQRVRLTSTNRHSEAVMARHQQRQLSAFSDQSAQVRDAMGVFERAAERLLHKSNINPPAGAIKASYVYADPHQASFSFAAKVPTPGGQRLITGEGSVALSPRGALAQRNATKIKVTTNRRTVWGFIQHLARRGR